MRNFKKRTYRVPSPDPVYNSRLVSLLINKVMKNGKKTVAQKIVYKALDRLPHLIAEDRYLEKKGIQLEKNPAFLLEKCVKKLTPLVVTRIHRWRGGRGRKGYLYRMSVYKKACFSINWIILGAKARTKSGRNLAGDLAKEILDLLKGKESNSIKLRDGLNETASEFIHFYYPKVAFRQAPDSKTKQLSYYMRISKYRAKRKRFLK